MAVFEFSKLIFMSMLVLTLLVGPATAGESDTEEELPEKSSSSVAVAVTLILSFTFLISLQCLMNHHDMDMREYAYTGISLTVSIFSAVLFFQSFEGILTSFISEPLQKATGWGETAYVAVNIIHMMAWYAASQIIIAYVSCALKPRGWRLEALQHLGHGSTHTILDVEIKSVCYGNLSAHVTGFASVKVFSSLQQLPLLRESPLLTLVAIPVTVLVQLCLEWFTDICRALHDFKGPKDWFHRTWDENCQNAEDDIMGLTVSVMLVNSARYGINRIYGHKCLPDAEQEEEGSECEFQHSLPEALWLFGIGLLFVTLLFLTKLTFFKIGAKYERAEERRERARTALVEGDEEDHDDEGGSDETLQKQFTERLEDVMLTTWGMAYSWCIFHSSHQLLVVLNPADLGKEQYSTTLAVILAFGVTYIAWILIRILDIIADLPDEWTPTEIDDAIKTVIRGTSIFVGFAWERTFDLSIGQLARTIETDYVTYGPKSAAVAKLLISGVCIAVVFFSWRWYILPYVFKKGWRYGPIFSKHDLKDRCNELAFHDESFLEFLHHICHSMTPDERKKVDFAHLLLENASYRALPCTELEAMHAERKELKARVQYLEQQLAEERKVGEDCRVHSQFLEWRLADNSTPRLYIKTRCDICGHESMRHESVKEADSREYTQEFWDYHREEDSKAQARCSRVGEDGTTYSFPSSRSQSPSPGKLRPVNSAKSLLAGATQAQGRVKSKCQTPEHKLNAERSLPTLRSPRISRAPSVSAFSRQTSEASVSALSARSGSALEEDCGKIHVEIGRIMSALQNLDR